MSIRVGIGVDAHALAEGVPLVLAGVEFPGEPGLVGHSDGDVLSHALVDAILGAAGLGDIGWLFPSGDDRWSGASSLDLLARAYGAVREAGFELVNADCVLVGERPRLAPVTGGDAHEPGSRDGCARKVGCRSGHDDRRTRLHGPGRGACGDRGRPRAERVTSAAAHAASTTAPSASAQ